MTQCLPELDLVMWVKNGQKTLAMVLKQINDCSKGFNIGQKIVVDDASIDWSKAIATAAGWKVIRNEGSGISDGANTALKYVGTDLFCSFEQDILLSPDWFSRIPKLLQSKVVVASGVRMPFVSESLTAICQYEVERYRENLQTQFGRTLDNTCYNRKWLESIGGFPKLSVAPGVDCAIVDRINHSDKVWLVDSSVQSDHLHDGIWDELRHYYWYGKNQKGIDGSWRAYCMLGLRAFTSPIRGADIAISQKNLGSFFVYPALRYSSFLGALGGLL